MEKTGLYIIKELSTRKFSMQKIPEKMQRIIMIFSFCLISDIIIGEKLSPGRGAAIPPANPWLSIDR